MNTTLTNELCCVSIRVVCSSVMGVVVIYNLFAIGWIFCGENGMGITGIRDERMGNELWRNKIDRYTGL